jgi:hypothetical protein
LTTNDHDLERRAVTVMVPSSEGSLMLTFMLPDEGGETSCKYAA